MQEKRWETLDNTANIFPVISGETLTNTYRISVELSEPIDQDALQTAVDMLTPKFPGFDVRLRSGVFWYYLEENGKPAPRVDEDHHWPCRFINANKNNSYLFNVSYYKNRINLSVFHAIADGVGGIYFLKELTYQYLRLINPELRERLGDKLTSDVSINRDDSFLENFRKASKINYKQTSSFHIRGTPLPMDGFGIFNGYMDVNSLKEVCRDKYNCSINTYLVCSVIWGIYRANLSKITKEKPVRIAIPVNLRSYFSSETTKNFFCMVSAEFYPKEDREYSFDEILAAVEPELKAQLTRENLEKVFSYNVSNETNIYARMVPLPIKNIAIKLIYNKTIDAHTTTVTNVGEITVADDYKPYIKSFRCILPFAKGQEFRAAICSYDGRLTLSISSAYASTAIQKNIFRQISSDGVSVLIETNGVYY